MENPKPPVRALLITPSYATDIHRVIFTITTAQDLIKKTKTSRLYSHLDWYTVTGTGVNIWFVLGMGGGYHESQINKYGCIVNIICHSPSVLSILLFIFLPSCPLPHTCQLCLPALSKLEFFSLALRKIALSLKCFSHPFLLPPYPFSLHVHACLSYYYHHCWYPLSSTFNYYVFHHIHV